jgi:hypothetical protein
MHVKVTTGAAIMSPVQGEQTVRAASRDSSLIPEIRLMIGILGDLSGTFKGSSSVS